MIVEGPMKPKRNKTTSLVIKRDTVKILKIGTGLNDVALTPRPVR
jgi:hypothetical protein